MMDMDDLWDLLIVLLKTLTTTSSSNNPCHRFLPSTQDPYILTRLRLDLHQPGSLPYHKDSLHR